MNKKDNVPLVRFKGFAESWEQYKLNDLGGIVTGSTPSTYIHEYYSSKGIPWVTPTDIYDHITYETPRKLSKKGQLAGRVVPKDTILVTCIASIGKNTILGSSGSFNQQINGIITNLDKFDPYFLYTQSKFWSDKMLSNAGGLTFQIVNKTEFSKISTLIPNNLTEQRVIGKTFKTLDILITLHQREWEKEIK